MEAWLGPEGTAVQGDGEAHPVALTGPRMGEVLRCAEWPIALLQSGGFALGPAGLIFTKGEELRGKLLPGHCEGDRFGLCVERRALPAS